MSRIIRPDPELKSAMFVSWLIVFVSVSVPLALLAALIPDTAGKIVFSVTLILAWMVLGPVALWIPAYCRSIEYSIDSDAVRMRHGVFFKKHVTVPPVKITNVDVSQGPVQRRFGIGTIHLQTAGAGGAQGAQAELRIMGVRDFENLKDVLEALVLRRGISTAETDGERSAEAILEDILTEIRALRNGS